MTGDRGGGEGGEGGGRPLPRFLPQPPLGQLLALSYIFYRRQPLPLPRVRRLLGRLQLVGRRVDSRAVLGALVEGLLLVAPLPGSPILVGLGGGALFTVDSETGRLYKLQVTSYELRVASYELQARQAGSTTTT